MQFSGKTEAEVLPGTSPNKYCKTSSAECGRGQGAGSHPPGSDLPGGVQFGKRQSHSLLPRISTDGFGCVSTEQLPKLCSSITLPIYTTLFKITYSFVWKLSDGSCPPGKKIIGIKSKREKKGTCEVFILVFNFTLN